MIDTTIYTEAEQPRLEAITVDGLFGYLNIELSALSGDSSIFLIGDNGTGKTTLLKLIQAVIDGRWHTLHEIEFRALNMVFSLNTDQFVFQFFRDKSGRLLWIDKSNDRHLLPGVSVHEYREISNLRAKAEWIEKNDPEIGRASCGNHWTSSVSNHMREEELVPYWEQSKLPNFAFTIDGVELRAPDRSALKNLKTHLVRSDRLLHHHVHQNHPFNNNQNQSETPIEIIQIEIRNIIRNSISRAFSERDRIGNQLLNEWMRQAVEIEDQDEDIDSLIKSINEFDDQLHRLSPTREKVSLEIPDMTKLPDEYDIFLKFYLKSRKKQLEAISPFLILTRTFLQIVNSAIRYKHVSINDELGLQIFLGDTGDGPEIQNLNDLSSGEKHIIFLAHSLVFEAERGAFVLIDEPELSLHMDWQRDFIEMLSSLTNALNFRFLCATHSPSIVGDRIHALRRINPEYAPS